MSARRYSCPACHVPLAHSDGVAWQRVTELTCASCGAQIEIRFGAWSYHLLKAISLIGWQAVAFVALPLAFFRQWLRLTVLVAGAVALEAARVYALRRGAQVHWINEESMRRRAAGRWVPE